MSFDERLAPGASGEARLSVVVPALNEAAGIGDTLDSVVRSLGPDTEIIVVDGGSSDETMAISQRMARLLHARPVRGVQLNEGALAAGGAVLLFLHADTWLQPGAGAALRDALRQDDVVGGCFSLRLRGPTAGSLIARALAGAINLRSRWLRSATGDQAIFCRREAFSRTGGFPELSLFEDVIFYRRLAELGRVTVLEPPALTSDRRWRRSGYLRTIALHLWLRALFLLGVHPGRLARLYTPEEGSGIDADVSR